MADAGEIDAFLEQTAHFPESLRNALQRVRREISPEVITPIAEALGNDDRATQETILDMLKALAEQGTVQPLYELWLSTRHPRATVLLAEGGWMPEFPWHLKVFRCLEEGRLTELTGAGADVVAPLVVASVRADEIIRSRAISCIEQLTNPDALDALAAEWVRSRLPHLRKIIERGIVARTPPHVRVLSALAADRLDLLTSGGADLVVPLIEACTDEDPGLARRAARVLPRLNNPEAVDRFCDVWAHQRSAELDGVLVQAGYVAASPLRIRVLSALKSGKPLSPDEEGPALVYPLVLALDDRDPKIRERAVELLLRALERHEFQEALCRAVIEHGSASAATWAVDKGFRPVDVRNRALFYFLTEQWEEYESLDFDMSLLTEAYRDAGKNLRARISKRARQAGRLELVELVAGVRHKRRMGEMTVREWDVTLGILEDRRDWETLWRLAQAAPPVWGVRALNRLEEVGWSPENGDQRSGFRRLLDLARPCNGEAPILGVVDRPTAGFVAHQRRVSKLIISSYFQSTLATGSWDGTVRIWSMPDGALLETLPAHRHPVSALAANPDGSLLAGGCGAEPWVVIWSMPDGKQALRLADHAKGVAGLAISPDGRLLAAAGYDGTCNLWRLRDGSLLNVLRGHGAESVRSVAFSPDGKLLATGGEDGRVLLWTLPDGKLTGRLAGHSMTVRSLVFTPDGSLLAGGSSDESVNLWSMSDRTLLKKLKGHSNVISSLAVSGDGRVLASGSWDRSVRLWILPEGKPWGTLEEHTGPVTCLATDPESRVLVSGGHDCTVMMWNFQSGILRRPTTRQDMDRVERLSETAMTDTERSWIAFLLAQMRWRWRFDIEVEHGPARIAAGEFDIEIEG